MILRIGVLSVLLLALADVGEAGEGYAVGERFLGVVGGSLDAKEFADALQAGGHEAKPGAVGPRWWRPTSTSGADKPLVILNLGLGEQAEAYAFDFSGPDRSLVRAVHIPYRRTYIYYSRSYVWIVPTSGLAAAFQGALEKPLDDGRASLALTVREWEAAEEEEEVGGGIEEMSAGLDINKLQALPYKQAGPILTAMAWWGAWANGWRPTHGAGTDRARLDVRMKYKSMDLRLTVTTPKGESRALQRNVPEEWAQATLVRMFWSVRNPGVIHDLGRAAVDAVSPVHADGERFLFVRRGVLLALDPVTGKQVYPPLPEPGAKAPARPPIPITYARNRGRLLRTSSRIAAVAPEDGSETILAPEGVAKPWMVSLGPGGRWPSPSPGMPSSSAAGRRSGIGGCTAPSRPVPFLRRRRLSLGRGTGR